MAGEAREAGICTEKDAVPGESEQTGDRPGKKADGREKQEGKQK